MMTYDEVLKRLDSIGILLKGKYLIEALDLENHDENGLEAKAQYEALCIAIDAYKKLQDIKDACFVPKQGCGCQFCDGLQSKSFEILEIIGETIVNEENSHGF